MAVVGNTRETILPLHSSFAVLFSLLFSRQASNPERSHEKGSGNGTVSITEIYYPTETSYLKSVLLWLQEYWTGPPVRIYPLRAVPQGSLHYSARSTHAALNRRNVIVDLPAFASPKIAKHGE
jgi:hypothetical protein